MTDINTFTYDKRKIVKVSSSYIGELSNGGCLGNIPITEIVTYTEPTDGYLSESQPVWIAIISSGQVIRKMPIKDMIIDYAFEVGSG